MFVLGNIRALTKATFCRIWQQLCVSYLHDDATYYVDIDYVCIEDHSQRYPVIEMNFLKLYLKITFLKNHRCRLSCPPQPNTTHPSPIYSADIIKKKNWTPNVTPMSLHTYFHPGNGLSSAVTTCESPWTEDFPLPWPLSEHIDSQAVSCIPVNGRLRRGWEPWEVSPHQRVPLPSSRRSVLQSPSGPGVHLCPSLPRDTTSEQAGCGGHSGLSPVPGMKI